MDTDKNRHDNWEKYIDPRINDLISKNFYLEAFYLYSATIESTLQECIAFQEEWIANLLKKSDLKFEKRTESELKDKTLGQLIKIFAKYCKDENLLARLNDFNSFRKKIVHRMLDFSIEQLNNEAEAKKVLYLNLVSKLSRYNLGILKKQIRSIKNNIRRTNKIL